MQQIAAKYNKTPAQVAINWVINKPNIVSLVKTSNPKHLEENLGALNWKLEANDESMLDSKFQTGETINVPRR